MIYKYIKRLRQTLKLIFILLCSLFNSAIDFLRILQTKCEQYWPDIGKKKKYGDVIVLNAKHNVFADYCFRTFEVTCGGETRKVHTFLFLINIEITFK